MYIYIDTSFLPSLGRFPPAPYPFPHHAHRRRMSPPGLTAPFLSFSIGPGVPQKCPETGSGYHMGGPLWNGPIYEPAFVTTLAEHIESAASGTYPSADRISAVLTNVMEELVDVPLFWDVTDLGRLLHVSTLKLDMIRSAIANAGFRVSGSHCRYDSISEAREEQSHAEQRRRDNPFSSLPSPPPPLHSPPPREFPPSFFLSSFLFFFLSHTHPPTLPHP